MHKQSSNFNPYEFNAGTSLAISTDSTIVIATDTRHCSEMGINSRSQTRIYKLDDFFIVLTGFYADGYDLSVRLQYVIMDYKSRNNRSIKISSLAHLLHNMLYMRRFFPYYSYAMLCGFDSDEPFIYSYDPVGSYSKTKCRVDGSGGAMIQPILDSLVDGKNWNCDEKAYNCEEIEDLVKMVFVSAAERDVNTGDALEMVVLKKGGFERKIMELRKD